MNEGQSLDPRAAAASKRGMEQLYGPHSDDAAAEQNFREALEFAPDFGDGHFHLAIALKAQGKLVEAGRSFETAARYLPGEARCHVGVGICRLEERKFDEAASWLLEAIALKPARGEADARILLASAYEESGDLEKAAVQWRHVAAMEQGDASVDFAMVAARRKLQEYDL